ncbi:hypothetical protein DCC79_04170 [bacterium]|nr:MAG: hypothetical protein DCC79_04170 [bacterium]
MIARNPDPAGPRRLRRWAGAAAWVVCAASTAAGLATARAPWSPAAAPAAAPLGTWWSVANGDRVQAILHEGQSVWSATEGGVVRWDAGKPGPRQYLAPQDGLPDNRVRALARDRAGVLWAGTGGGLARFDPLADRWVAVLPPADRIPSPSVTALAAAPDGGLWVGFETRWDAAALPDAAAEPGAFVGGGVARFDGATGRWGAVYRAERGAAGRFAPLPSDTVTALLVDDAGRLWVGTRPFMVWDRLGDPDPATGRDWGWVTTGGGLALREPSAEDRWTQWQAGTAPCIPSVVHALAVDAAGRVWAGGGNGLHVFTAGAASRPCVEGAGHAQYARRPSGRGMPANTVLAVDFDRQGNVWMGLANGVDEGRGLMVLDHAGTLGDPPGSPAARDDTWTAVALPGPADATAVVPSALTLTDGGGLWVGTRGEAAGDGWGLLSRTPEGVWSTHATAAAGLPSNRVSVVARHPASGELWFGTDGRGVARWDGRTWQAWRFTGEPGGLPGDHVTAIAFGHDGRVWAAARPSVWGGKDWADGGVAGWDGQAWRTPVGAPSRFTSAQALAVDLDGRLWIGTVDEGAATYDPAGDRWVAHAAPAAGPGFGGMNVSGIAVDPVTGHVWLAHQAYPDWVCDPAGKCERPFRGGGVSRWDGRGWTRWAKSTGAPLAAHGDDGEMTSIAFDRGRGRVWAGGWAGRGSFHWLTGVGIDGTLDGCMRPCDAGDWTSERFPDGGAVRALAVDAEGRLWAALHRNHAGSIPPAAGIRILDAQAGWRTVSAADGLPADEVAALAPAPDGMWVGLLDRGAAVWRPFEVRDRAFLPRLGQQLTR